MGWIDYLMTVPVINAYIDFSSGAVFAPTMVLDSGVLGTNALGDSASVIVDVSSQVDSLSTTRGRNATSDQFQTGTMTLRIVDLNGDFNPQNPSSPYAGLLSPMRKVVISATYSGVTYPIFSGYITAYATTTPKSVGEVTYTVIQAVDGFRLANNAQVSTIDGAGVAQKSGTRINKILDAIGWPTGMRDVDEGLTTVQADTGTLRTGLAAMQNIELSEYGSLYVNASGDFVFQDRTVTTESIGGTPVVFNDNGTAIPYFNAKWLLNDSLIYNYATITREGGTVQTASNAASIEKYFTHSYNQSGLMMETDAEALNYALAYVASRQETSIRCDAITLDLYTNNYNDGIIAALDLDFFDPVTITTTQSGSSSITKTLQVFGVSHNLTPNSWKTTLTTLEPIIDGFILGSTEFGVLGTSVLAY